MNPRSNQKILVCLQTWEGDLPQATALAQLIAEVTLLANAGQKSPHADFMMAYRFDCPMDMTGLREAGKAFHRVHSFRSRTQKRDWPAGPNALASDVFKYYVEKQNSTQWNYSAIWLIEPDSVPLKIDFLARVHNEWMHCGKHALGAFVGGFPGAPDFNGTEHLNGNALLHHDLARLIHGFIPGAGLIAWDAASRKQLMPLAHPSRQIHSDYQLGTEKNPWKGCDAMWAPIMHAGSHPLAGVQFEASWLHGSKTPEAIVCVRERLLAKATTP